MPQSNRITVPLLAEILRDSHRYSPGVRRNAVASGSVGHKLVLLGREYCRDFLERAAARTRFSHRHFDPEVAAQRLGRILELSEGLEATYAALGDEHSRRAMLDVLKLRVLGPRHSPLRITEEEYRVRQTHVDRALRSSHATFEVSDPYFSPLSLYSVPVYGETVSLHSHSVDVVSVYQLHQYSYSHESHRVGAEPGDVVIDVGGCWGDTALYFASLVGERGKVYVFEFDPENLEILRTNLALNPRLASRIEVVERALWNRSGETLEFVQAGRMTSLRGPGEPRGSIVKASTLTVDEFVAERRLSRVDFVKMDVEGAESAVIAGSRETLGRFAPRLAIAAYHRDDDLVVLPAALASSASQYSFYLDSFSPFEDETVLFAVSPRATASSKRM